MIRRPTIPLTVALACLIVLGTVAAAAPLERELPIRVKVKGSIEIDGGVDTYVFDAVAGLLLTASLEGGSKNVLPALEITDPLGADLPVPASSSSGKTKLSKHILTVGGRYRIRITTTQAGEYTLKLKARPDDLEVNLVVPASGTAQMTFEALAGSTVKIKGKWAEKKGPIPVFVSLTDPDDDDVDATARLRTRSDGFKISKLDLEDQGAYTLTVSLDGDLEGGAAITVELSDPPNSGKLFEDDLLAGRVLKLRARGPAASAEGYLFQAALLDTPSVTAVTLEIPDRDDRALTRDLAAGTFTLSESFVDESGLDTDFPDGEYTLRITYGEGEGDQTLSFTVGGSFPDDPTPDSPADGATSVPLAPTLTWTAVADAVSYDVEMTREGLTPLLFSFSTDDPTEVTTDVPAGLLVDGPVYRLLLAAQTSGFKVAARVTRFTTAGPDFEFTNAKAEKILSRRPGVNFNTGEVDYGVTLMATFDGAGVMAAQLEYVSFPGFNPVPIYPTSGSAGFSGQASMKHTLNLAFHTMITLTNLVFPDGVYQIRVLYMDESEAVSDPITIGGMPHEFPDRFDGTRDGYPANVLTPSWDWIQDEDEYDDDLTRTYHVVIDDTETGENVLEADVEANRPDSIEKFGVVFTVPDDTLDPKREYRLTWHSDTGTGWVTRTWTVFTTGSDLNRPNFTSVGKDIQEDGEGVIRYSFAAETLGATLNKAHIRDPQGNLLALRKKDDDGSFRLRIYFDTKEAMDQALPDGRYTFVLGYDDKTPDVTRAFDISGEYPVFPTITTPMHGEQKVATDPGIAWTYPQDEVDTILGFFTTVGSASTDKVLWAASAGSGSLDTKVPSTQPLQRKKKYGITVMAMGLTRKNAQRSIIFKTK
jgi:hypothetical protein